MAKARKPKSIRDVMAEVGKTADAKLDEISRSVKKNEKNIDDIRKTLKDVKAALARIRPPAKKATAAKKGTARKRSPAKKRAAPKRKRK